MTAPPVPYAGIATRAVGLAIDVALAEVSVFAVGAVLALVGSLADLHAGTVVKILGAVAWAVAVGTYFVVFWSTAGQTPGMRVMGLRVTMRDGSAPSVARSVVRLVGLVLSILPLFAGFLPVLVDDRRRGLLDFLAGTVVVYTGQDDPGHDPARARPSRAGPSQPPATAGRMVTSEPSATSVSSPSAKRMSSPPT